MQSLEEEGEEGETYMASLLPPLLFLTLLACVLGFSAKRREEEAIPTSINDDEEEREEEREEGKEEEGEEDDLPSYSQVSKW